MFCHNHEENNYWRLPHHTVETLFLTEMHVSEDDKESVWCVDQGMCEGVRADAQVWRPKDSIVCPA